MSKKLSGAEFRKKAKEREKKNEKFLSKVPKISGFLLPRDKQPCPDTSVVEDEGVVVSATVTNSDNLQSELENSELESQTERNISDDPALWNIDDKTREHITKNGFKQNVDADFSASERIYGLKKRWCTKGYFEKHLKNGEIKTRDWLVYSPSKASVFCAYCRLFGNDASSSFCEGFNDWKNAVAALQSHENSPAHRSSVLSYVSRTKVENRIDKKLVEALESDVKYWREVLKRVVATIKYLATRGYPFRGSENLFGSSRNGAYIGALELLAQFDPFLSQHIYKHANKGQGSTSYLSHFTCDEIIIIMGNTVLKRIIQELKKAKYYSLIVDSTPDIAHVDQLTLVVRYVLQNPNGTKTTPVERFVEFLPNTGHKAEELARALFKTLESHGIDIKDCRGQSFDNASNMAGVYSGLQARIKEQCPLAEYIPCSSHSLNLVGVASAEASEKGVAFSDLVQGLYNFFGASTHRWEILKSALKDRFPVVKSLSITRWSARADALKAIYKSFPDILKALENIICDENEKPTTRQEAKGLGKRMMKLENAFLLIFWKEVMEKFWKVNATLQSETIDLGTVGSLFDSLKYYVQELRNKFDEYASAAEMLTKSDDWGERRARKRKRFFDEMPSNKETNELDPKEIFRINVFLLIVDRITTELDKRANAYKGVHHKFGFLLNLRALEDNAIKSKCKELVELYKDDLEECFSDECVQFKYYLNSENSESEREDENVTKKKRPSFKPLLQLIHDKNLQNIFPNMEIVLRIVLSTAVTNCSGERSFSVLKRVKNHLRNSLSQCKLNALSVMAIESDLTESLDFEEISTIFVESKQRRKLP